MNDLAFAGAAAQARMLANGDLSAPELLEVYLERIARLDSQLRCYRVVLVVEQFQLAVGLQQTGVRTHTVHPHPRQ